jgi:serine/threonine-protein kinase RsbW
MARRILAATLGTVGVTEECRADILLALAEACSNAVNHARPADKYQVAVDIDDARCMIEVIDSGVGLTAVDLPEERPEATLDEAGRGLHIIRTLSDQFRLTSKPSGTHVWFAKRLERPTTDT